MRNQKAADRRCATKKPPIADAQPKSRRSPHHKAADAL